MLHWASITDADCVSVFEHFLTIRSFSKGDIFVIASDGLPEAPNLKGEQLGYQAVEDCIQVNADKTAEEIKDALVALGSDWLAGQTTPDDITIVVIKHV